MFLLDRTPDLEILHRVPVLILRRTLPGDQVGTEGRETQLEDICGRDGGNDVSDRGVNDRDAGWSTNFTEKKGNRHTYPATPTQSTGHMENKRYSGDSPQVYPVSYQASPDFNRITIIPHKPRQRLINRSSIQDTDSFQSSDCATVSKIQNSTHEVHPQAS